MAPNTSQLKLQRRRVNPLAAGISGSVSLIFVVALWLLFAPTTMGGKFAYFFVVGNSMEPQITANDLVFLRAADRYEVGDVIGYRDPILGTVVHRIRALDGDRYITRGDNRDSDDPYRPFQSDVLGREWYVLHKGAHMVRTFQSPKSAVALTVLSVAFGLMQAKPRRPTRRMRRMLEKRTPTWVGHLSYKSMTGDSIVTLSSTLLFTAVGLAGVMLWNGTERIVTKDIVLEQSGKLEYTALAGTGLYDGDKVTTGQPIFTQLGTQMPVSFTYEVKPVSKDATVGGVRGMVRLAVELSQDNKWTREFEIMPATPFAGSVATAQGTVDLKALQETADHMEQTALLKYPLYTVRLIAEVKANGNITGRAQDFVYRTQYPFQLHDRQLIPGLEFKPVALATLNVKRDSLEPWSTALPVIGTRIDYTTLQALTLVLGLAGAGALGVVYVSTMLAARGGETALILARYAPLLVSVQAANVDFGGRIVAVKKFEDLVRIARADGLFVVHAENGVADHFLLVTSEVTYLYSVPRLAEEFRFEEQSPPSPNEVLSGLMPPDTTTPLATAPVLAGTTGPTITFHGSTVPVTRTAPGDNSPAPGFNRVGARLFPRTDVRAFSRPPSAPSAAGTAGPDGPSTSPPTRGKEPPATGGKALV